MTLRAGRPTGFSLAHSAPFVLSILAACGTAHEEAARAERVFLITCDTLRADRLGTYGYEYETSPRLDALARESVVFDRAYSGAPSTLPSMCSLLTGRLPANIGVEHNRGFLHGNVTTLAEALSAQGIATAAVVSNWVLLNPATMPDSFGVRQGFDHFDGELPSRELVRGMPERRAIDTTDAAIAWLEGQSDLDQRFFLWVHYQDPHGPYTPPARFVEMMKRPPSDEKRLPFGQDQNGRGAIPLYQRLGNASHPDFYRTRYDAEVRFFDQHVGRLLDYVKSRDLFDDALVIFTADHGESLGENGYWFCHGETLSQELLRVPFFVRYPSGLRPGNETQGRSERLVSSLDIWPTVMQALDLSPGTFSGTSLMEPPPERSVAVQTLGFERNASVFAVTDGRYRLYLKGDEAVGLFDLEQDPAEVTNLFRKRPEVINGLVEGYASLNARDEGPRFQSRSRELSEDEEEILQGLGYTSGKDE